MTTSAKKEKIISAAKKFLDDKKIVAAYLRGEVTKETLDERGIKLALPL